MKKIIIVVKFLERKENLEHSDILVSGKKKKLYNSEVVLRVHPLISWSTVLCLSKRSLYNTGSHAGQCISFK